MNKELLALLLPSFSQRVMPYFSYPGRFADPVKKREVIEVILSTIRNAKFSLKVYAYSLNNPEVIAELVEAKKRGVKIEIVGDKERNYQLLKDNGFVVNIWKQSGLHHIKVIFADNKIFFTGTGNFSRYGLTHDWNGYIQFEVEENNRIAMQEFLDEKLNEPVLFTNGIYFISSPKEGFLSQDLLLEKIQSAKLSIEYLIFDHFDSVMTHALKQASSRGVTITGVYDSPIDTEGIYLTNQFYGISSGIYKDGNEDIIETESFPEGGLLHHKTIIIDGKTLLSGSYNYSASARDSNREILFLTEDYHLVSEFQKEFQRVRDRSYKAPITGFHTYPSLSFLNSSNLSGNTLCLPENINLPIIELGLGIWRTTLYYPKLNNFNCISLSNYADISSGISGSSKADFFSLGNLWNSYQVFDRDSTRSYSYFKNEDSILSNSKRILQKNPNYFTFSSTRIYFEMNEDLNITGKTIYLWIPGKEFRSAKLEQPSLSDLGYSASIPTTTTERGYIAGFIDASDSIYYFCFIDKTRTVKVAFDYLSKRIYMKNKLEFNLEKVFESCIGN